MGTKKGIYVPDHITNLIDLAAEKGHKVNWSEAAVHGFRLKLTEIGPLMEDEKADTLLMSLRLKAESAEGSSTARKQAMLARRVGWHWANYYGRSSQLNQIYDSFIGCYQWQTLPENHPFPDSANPLTQIIDWNGFPVLLGPDDESDYIQQFLPWTEAYDHTEDPDGKPDRFDPNTPRFDLTRTHWTSRDKFETWLFKEESTKEAFAYDLESSVKFIADKDYSAEELHTSLQDCFDMFLTGVFLAYRKLLFMNYSPSKESEEKKS